MNRNKYNIGQKVTLTNFATGAKTSHTVLEVTTPYDPEVGGLIPLYKLSGLPSAIRVSEEYIEPLHLGVVND